MPELPEVETVVRGVRPFLEGSLVTAVAKAAAVMVESTVGSFRRGLVGRRFTRLTRQGKWMFADADGDRCLILHLGMSGRLVVGALQDTVVRHTHLRVRLRDVAGEERELRFIDPRRFGVVKLCTPSERAAEFGAGKLGPDALTASLENLRQGLGRSRRSVKALLLDQAIVAGVGNIYADEALYAARLYPGRRGRDLAAGDIARLHRAVIDVLRRAVENNGTSIRDYVTGFGVPGEFQSHLCVYGRGGRPCGRCRTPILVDRSFAAGRSTHWCPVCQPARARVRRGVAKRAEYNDP